jgi:CBS domain containing-hemolysin-like protein
MVFVRDSATVQDVLEAARHSGHSRLPVFHETRDQIVGIVYIKDLLSHLEEPNWKTSSIRDLLRKPLFVPETKNVDDLMEEFQRDKVHLGIVLDEYGGTAGLITIEDIIEELIGEIRDEHDPDEASLFRQVDERAYELGATVRVEEVNDFLNVNLPEDEDFDTVGGYVAFALGRLPTSGETFERDGVRITVLEADARRVKRVRIENLNGRP